jgi:Ca2+-transporting ATPase
LAEHGPNVVAHPRPRRLVTRVLWQLRDPLVALLIAALVVTIAIGDYTDAAVIALVVIVNSTIGVVQEVRADRAIAALDTLVAPNARVVRDGRDLVVPAAEVVPGDLVRLEAGDIVPADLLLEQSHRLLLDESSMTGEAVPVARTAGEEAAAGAVVLVGRAAGAVVRTGGSSGLGRIAALVAATRPGPTPLQRRLSVLGRVLGLAAVALSALVFVIGVLAGRDVVDMAITAVSLVVAAVPESLPAVVTVALALAARRMAAQRAIPRRLHAVETLGSVTIVASDKTGTLTEGRMAVQRVVGTGGAEYVVTGHGYEPDASIARADNGCAVDSPPESIRELAQMSALCNDAALAPPSPEQPRWRAVGDPMEAALLAFATRCGLSIEDERASHPRVAERPFDQESRRMTTVHREGDGQLLVVCKGAPEAVLQTPLLSAVPAGAVEAADRLAASGLRVLAVAASTGADVASIERPTGLRLVGLVGIGDPLRDNAATAASDFDAAGIRLVLITGDHPGTAAAIGTHLGIWRVGDELHHGGEGAPEPERAARVRVFARTQPEQKLDIIAGLQAQGNVVAMTGDGVNDAPALRRADIGVAMGGGTEVARQAADLILVDDNLGTIAVAVREGRRIYDNIRRFLLYALAGGTAEILVMLCGPLLGLTVPLLPAQILWINLLTHGVPGVALGAEPAEPGVMRRPPRRPQDSVLGDGLLGRVIRAGLILSAAVLAAGVLAHAWDWAWQSVVFVTLGLGQLGIALAVRAPRSAGARNRGLTLALLISGLLQVAGVLFGPLRGLLGTAPLGLTELGWCLVVAAVPGLVMVALDRYARSR